MTFYWTLKSIPELSAEEPSERRRLWRAAVSKAHRHWQPWLALFGIWLVTFLASGWGTRLGYPVAGGMVGAFIGSIPYQLVINNLARPYLRALQSEKKSSVVAS